ncbi:MAG: hypothetical protein ACRD98_00340 [Nitrososphaera sp.]
MADSNFVPNTSGASTFRGVDGNTPGVITEVIRTGWGANTSENLVDDVAGKRLPVKIGEALPAGTNSIGTVDTELPAAASLADATANPTTPSIGALNLLFNGAAWDRVRGDVTNGVDVDVTRMAALVAGTANIGDVDVVTMPTGALAAQVQGTVAHDAPVAQNPVRIAFRANLNEPAAVSADGDTTEAWADREGRQVVLLGHSNPEPPVTLNATVTGNTTVIAAPGAGVSLHIMKGTINNRDATNRLAALTDGAAGTVRFRAEIMSEGGWVPFDFGSRGWKLTANTALVLNLDAAGNVDVNILEHYIAA